MTWRAKFRPVVAAALAVAGKDPEVRRKALDAAWKAYCRAVAPPYEVWLAEVERQTGMPATARQRMRRYMLTDKEQT